MDIKAEPVCCTLIKKASAGTFRDHSNLNTLCVWHPSSTLGCAGCVAEARNWPGHQPELRPVSVLWCGVYNVSAVLQCEMLAHGAPRAHQRGWRWCAVSCSSLQPGVLVLAVGVLAERSSLAGVRRAVAHGRQAPGASSAVRSRAVRPGQLPALPEPSVLLLHSWSGQELVLCAGWDIDLAVLP